jgi:hypothetical protein
MRQSESSDEDKAGTIGKERMGSDVPRSGLQTRKRRTTKKTAAKKRAKK